MPVINAAGLFASARAVVFALVFALLAIPVQAAVDEPARAKDPVIKGIEIKYPGKPPADTMQLIDMKVGERLSGRKLRESIKLLYLKGIFENIIVDGRDSGGGVVLVYDLIPRLKITDIKLRGTDEISKKRVKAEISMQPGEFFDDDAVNRSIENILKLYREEGYRSVEVNISTEAAGPGLAVLRVEIKEGPPTVVKEVRFTGKPGRPVSELRRRLKFGEKDVLRKADLDNSVSALEAVYLKDDYVNVKVQPVVTYSDNLATVEFAVTAGQRLEVEFIGNKGISARNLRKKLTFWDEKDASEESVSDNLDRLRDYYKSEGYYFSGINSRTEETEASFKASFVITENQRVRLGQIVITGNKEVDSASIKEVLALRESSFFVSRRITDESVAQDIERIKNFYESRGFLAAQVKARELEFSDVAGNARLTLDITEGPRIFISRIGFSGNAAVSPDSLSGAVKLKAGQPYNPQTAKTGQDDIIAYYSQMGYVNAEVETAPVFSEDGRGVGLVYNISEGPQVRVGRIILRGNEATRDKTILREMMINAGDVLDYEKILRSQQQIYRLGFLKQVKIQPVEADKPEKSRDLLISVKERKAGLVEFGVGYGDWDKLRGFGEVGYRNLFGLGHRVSARAELSSKEEKGIVTYKWPWFMDYKLDYRLSFVYMNADKPNYHIRDMIAVTGFDKTFGEHITSSFVYQYEKVKLGTIRAGAELAPEDRKKSNIASISPSAIFDYRDNPFNPTRGQIHGVNVKLATRFLGSTVDFVKATAQTSLYFPVYKNVVLAVSARGGISDSLNNKFEVPISERFFIGGSSSVRGYGFESVAPKIRISETIAPGVIKQTGQTIGGDTMVQFNVELRVPLPYGFGIVGFLDGGNSWLRDKGLLRTFDLTPAQNLEEVETGRNGLRYGAGIGLRYTTPVGPIRLDYAFKIGRLPGESASEIHFTVGQAF